MVKNTEFSTKRIIFKTFKQKWVYPYHPIPAKGTGQNLLDNDFLVRLEFVNICRTHQNANPMILNTVLFTDGASFARRGILIFRNKHE